MIMFPSYLHISVQPNFCIFRFLLLVSFVISADSRVITKVVGFDNNLSLLMVNVIGLEILL